MPKYSVRRKYEEIPILSEYESDPGTDFWKLFPFNELPTSCMSNISAENIKICLDKVKINLTDCQYNRGLRCVDSLLNGASACQKETLPSCVVNNAKNTVKYGPEITDNVVAWSYKKFLAGPFLSPPLPLFRVNPLIAIDQGEKIRPVLNVSLPENNSFNSNINNFKLEKVEMSTAKKIQFYNSRLRP